MPNKTQKIVLYSDKNDQNLYREAIDNWREFRISRDNIKKIKINDINEFLIETEKHALKVNHKPAYFYVWIDKQGLSINYSFISFEYKRLPFDSNHIIIDDKVTASEIFYYELQIANAEANLRRFREIGIAVEMKNNNLCECENSSYTYVYKTTLTS